MQFSLLALVVAIAYFGLSTGCPAKSGRSTAAGPAAALNSVTPGYCSQILNKVDGIVRKHFVDARVASTTWPEAVKAHRRNIVSSRNLAQLADRMNALIKTLNMSHCQFLTPNDETYYFLRSLFGQSGKRRAPPVVFSGAIMGGVNCGQRQVRYVLDGSPGALAGLQPGDVVLAVDGKPFIGQLSFAGTAGRSVRLRVLRDHQPLELTLKPVLKDLYSAYVEAIEKSARLIRTADGTLGYVHLWTGGQRAHDAFEDLLGGKLNATAGLILDLRDGYGANFFDDLDYFYRPPNAYPATTTTTRSGKKRTAILYYDKPVVALINGGVRSGKELLAFSFKRSGRAKLVGERTAGAVVGGRLFAVDQRTALYLAVAAGDVGGVVLEGKGVEPDIVVPASCSRPDKDRQLAAAEDVLRQQLRAPAGTPSP
ncbi:MAG TPA: S41 family peptidase [Candidatus Obscuribacterales bacterium]